MKIKVFVFTIFAAVTGAWAEDPNSETCKTKPILQRIKNRDFPSIFQAWNECDTLSDQTAEAKLARHDLIFITPESMGLKGNAEYPGLSESFTAESLAAASEKQANLLKLNPNLIILAEIRCTQAEPNYLPDDHSWLMHDPNGNPIKTGDSKYIKLDLKNPEFREHIGKQAKAAIDSGVFDGVMLNYLKDDELCLELIKSIRSAIGPNPLILCSSGPAVIANVAPYINGYYMECSRTDTPEDWQQIADTLKWAENNLRKPTINCLQTPYHVSREELNLMRAVTTLTMTLSNGYCLFSDPDILPTPDHLHSWYPFWDAQIGKPTADGIKDEMGCYTRTFEQGMVVYNPMGNAPQIYKFPRMVKSAATGKIGNDHILESCDGDIYLNLPDVAPAASTTN